MPKRRLKTGLDAVPRSARKIIIAMREQAQTLTRTMTHSREGNLLLTYMLEPSGKRMTPRAAERAICSGFLISNNDGLFDGQTQTWRAPYVKVET